MTNFGASFKKARESKGISLDQIAMDTKISTRFLSAIESEELHLLPGGIFNRGFVRAYAEKVGLDPDQAVADYERLAEVREPTETISTAMPRLAKRDRNLYPIALGILAIVIVIFYVVTRESGHTAQSAATTPPPAPAPPPVVAQPAPPEVPPAITSAAPEPEPSPPSISPQALTLEVEAREQTWIKVTADGNAVDPGEILQPGMT